MLLRDAARDWLRSMTLWQRNQGELGRETGKSGFASGARDYGELSKGVVSDVVIPTAEKAMVGLREQATWSRGSIRTVFRAFSPQVPCCGFTAEYVVGHSSFSVRMMVLQSSVEAFYCSSEVEGNLRGFLRPPTGLKACLRLPVASVTRRSPMRPPLEGTLSRHRTAGRCTASWVLQQARLIPNVP